MKRAARSRLLLVALLMCGCPSKDPPVKTAETRTPPESVAGIAVAVLVDTSGSMGHRPGSGGTQTKDAMARSAIDNVLAVTDSFVEKHPDKKVHVSLWSFSGKTRKHQGLVAYNRVALRERLETLPPPGGDTAIGDAMREAATELGQSGFTRQHIVVITDGQSNSGLRPSEALARIRRQHGMIGAYFVAFDTRSDQFEFLSAFDGAEVFEAGGAAELETALTTIYERRILLEAADNATPIPLRSPSQ